MIVLPEPVTFQWDAGNIDKNSKHNVQDREIEEVFFDTKKVLAHDVFHSTRHENRYILLGKTKNNRVLYTVFTIRAGQIRVISSRDLNNKEVHLYEKKA